MNFIFYDTRLLCVLFKNKSFVCGFFSHKPDGDIRLHTENQIFDICPLMNIEIFNKWRLLIAFASRKYKQSDTK